MKKFILMLLTSVFACALVFSFACGDGTSGTGTKDLIEDPWWTTTGELEKDEDGNVVFEDVTIEMTTIVDGADQAALDNIISQFNSEYSGKIRVILTVAHQGIFDQTIALQISNNSNPPDLIMGHQKSYKAFTDMELLQPFDEVIESSGITITMDDYSASLAQYASMGYDGYMFGIPIDMQSCVVLYNKSILNEVGGTLPQSHEELLALCDSVKSSKNIVPIAMSTEDDFFTRYVFTTAVVQNGGSFYNEEYRAEWYDDETNLTAFTNGIASLRTLVDNGYAEFGLGSSSALNQFLEDKALFLICCPWDVDSVISAVANRKGLSEEAVMSQYVGATSLAYWFALDDTSSAASKVYGDSHFFAMSKSVTDIEVKAAICEFVKWFTSEIDVGIEWAEAGHASASTLVVNSNEYISSTIISEYISKYYPDVNNFECIGVTPYYDILIQCVESLFVNVKSNAQNTDANSIKAAQDSMNSLIDFAEM